MEITNENYLKELFVDEVKNAGKTPWGAVVNKPFNSFEEITNSSYVDWFAKQYIVPEEEWYTEVIKTFAPGQKAGFGNEELLTYGMREDKEPTRELYAIAEVYINDVLYRRELLLKSPKETKLLYINQAINQHMSRVTQPIQHDRKIGRYYYNLTFQTREPVEIETTIRAAFYRIKYNPLDEGFIPETIARVEEVNTLIQNAIGGGSGGGGVSSWNDLTDKPFYSETTISGILPKTTVEIAQDGGTAIVAASGVLTVGKSYTVIFDGTKYDCVAAGVDMGGLSVVVIGNSTLFGGTEGNGEPFFVGDLADGTFGIAVQTAGTHTVEVTCEVEIVHRLDEKYMPFGDLTPEPIYRGGKTDTFMLELDTDGDGVVDQTIPLVHVSNITPPVEAFYGVVVDMTYQGSHMQEEIPDNYIIPLSAQAVMFGEAFGFVVYDPNVVLVDQSDPAISTTLKFPAAGVYFAHIPETIEVNSLTFKEYIKKIDPKYLPLYEGEVETE